MSSIVDKMKQRVLFEDESLLAIDKPRGMPSVPLRNKGIRGEEDRIAATPRNLQWMAAIESTLTSSRDEQVVSALSGLKNLEAVPRKESSFKEYLRRVVRVHDKSLQEIIWSAVSQEDNRLLFPCGFVDGVPDEAVSAADVVSEMLNTGRRVYVVHRLDMETSGILLFAKTESACSDINAQFRNNEVKKMYIAHVQGTVDRNIRKISAKLRAEFENPPLQVVDEQEGKEAETLVEVVHRDEDSSLLHLHPISGRTHQLRVHCLSIGHPILGDSMYAPPSVVERAPGGLRLHAQRITLRHPTSQEELTIESSRCDFL